MGTTIEANPGETSPEQSGAPRRAVVTDLPIIDIGPFLRASTLDERKPVARALRAACIDIGFFYLVGHDFAAGEIDAMLTVGKRFFALPPTEKAKLARKNSEAMGYFDNVQDRMKDPKANPDIKERFFMSREPEPGEAFTRITPWPAGALAPDFEATMKTYIARQLALGQALVRAFALSLDLSEDYFREAYGQPAVLFALNYYPPVDDSKLRPNQWSFAPHTDFGGLTILAQDDIGGLQVRNISGEWIDVPPRPGTFVVNVGDLFAYWTNDLYVSTLHRGINRSAAARISGAYFITPNDKTIVRCIETCQSAGNPARHEPVQVGNYIRKLMVASYNSGKPGITDEVKHRIDSK